MPEPLSKHQSWWEWRAKKVVLRLYASIAGMQLQIKTLKCKCCLSNCRQWRSWTRSVVHTEVFSIVLSTVRCPAWPRLALQEDETLVPRVLSAKPTEVSLVATEHQLPIHIGKRIPPWGNAVSEAWRRVLKKALSGCRDPFGLSSHCCWGLDSVASIDRVILCYSRSIASPVQPLNAHAEKHVIARSSYIYQCCKPFWDISHALGACVEITLFIASSSSSLMRFYSYF